MHRNHCTHYKRHQAATLAKRKERAKAALTVREAALAKVREDIERKAEASRANVSKMIVILLFSSDVLLHVQVEHASQSLTVDVCMDTEHETNEGTDPPAAQVPALTAAGRPKRSYRLPARYEDVQPEGPAPVTHQVPSLPQVAPGSSALPRITLHVRDTIRTGINRFGLLREYPHRPSYDPDSDVSPEDLSNCSQARVQPGCVDIIPAEPQHPPPWPFQNMSTYLLMEWMITGSNQKTVGEMDRLVKNVIGSDEFKLDDIASFNTQRELHHLDSSGGDCSSPNQTPFTHDGWIEHDVTISVPNGLKNSTGHAFTIPGLHRRPLISVLKAALSDITSRRFHFSPFKRFWKTSSGEEQRCYDEAYTSDVWLKAHDDLQKQHNEPECKLEKVVLGLMFWSDSTHLTNFGTAKVWPLYMYIGNLSKYFRGKPTSGACHHVAYIPSVSPSSLLPGRSLATKSDFPAS